MKAEMCVEPVSAIKIWFDGGSTGKAYGSYEIDGGPELKHRSIRQDFGHGTSNQAEYLSLIAALKWLRHNRSAPPKELSLDIWTDSMLVCQQIKRRWKCRVLHLVELRDEALILLSSYKRWQISWHRRHNNVSRFGH